MWGRIKKSSRRRIAKIRMNRIQTGGAVPEYIPPDEILDKVLDMLGSTGSEDNISDDDVVSSVAEPRDSVASTSAVNPEICSSSLGTVNEVVEFGETTTRTMSMPRAGKRKLKINGKTKRDLAIADYYISKKKYVDANLKKIQLQNENLKQENESLKLEIINAMQ